MPISQTLISGLGINVPGVVPTTPAETPQNTALAVPAFLSNIPAIPSVEELPDGVSIYGFYSSSRSKNYDKCLKAGAAEGDAVIVVEGNYIPAKPLKFFLAAAFGCRSKMENDGSISRVSLDFKTKTEATPDEHYVTLLVVLLNNQLIPVKFDFRTTKSKAAEDTIRMLHQAQSPEWAKLGNDHRETVAFPIPWGKVFCEVTTQRKVGSSGLPYYQAIPTPRPASVAEMKMLMEAAGNVEFLATFERIKTEYEQRVSDLKAKIK
jgi:hypothetical protein